MNLDLDLEDHKLDHNENENNYVACKTELSPWTHEYSFQHFVYAFLMFLFPLLIE